jgi:hypothetical protein
VTTKATVATRSWSSSGNVRSRSLSSVMSHDTTDPSTDPQPTFADFYEWLPDGSREPCYGPAGFVLVRPDGENLRFSCVKHREGWATRTRGPYRVVGRAE